MRAAATACLTALVLVALGGGQSAAATEAPQETHLCPRADAPPFDARELVGLRVRRARATAERHDCLLRVVRRDGEPLIVTQDFLANRIDVAVRDHVVRRIVGIY
jgi:hypothetical protein